MSRIAACQAKRNNKATTTRATASVVAATKTTKTMLSTYLNWLLMMYHDLLLPKMVVKARGKVDQPRLTVQSAARGECKLGIKEKTPTATSRVAEMSLVVASRCVCVCALDCAPVRPARRFANSPRLRCALCVLPFAWRRCSARLSSENRKLTENKA